MRIRLQSIRFVALLSVLLLVAACQKRTGPSSSYVEGPTEEETRDQTLRRQDEIMRHQRLELERQQRELEDLERQKYYNRAIEPYDSQ